MFKHKVSENLDKVIIEPISAYSSWYFMKQIEVDYCAAKILMKYDFLHFSDRFDPDMSDTVNICELLINIDITYTKFAFDYVD